MGDLERDFAIDLAKKAGKIIKKNFSLGMKRELKSDTSEVTETDLAINQLILETIKRKFPSHSFLGEEGNSLSEESEFVWVCDPVDGTFPFTHGIPTSVFSLALTQKGESILGVVYDPFLDRMFVGEKGKGAFLNNKRIQVSQKSQINSSSIGICNWKRARFNFNELRTALTDLDSKLVDVVSITYMGALVSCGELDATVFPGEKPWDTAALKIIVEEAGGKVTDIYGNDQRYDQELKGHIVSNRILHEELVKLVKDHVK